MKKTKFYAVKIGRIPGIYDNWEDCKKQIDNFKGNKYKSFSSYEDAEQYLNEGIDNPKLKIQEFNNEIDLKISNLKNDELVAFVDGSYDSENKKVGFGVILIDNTGHEEHLYQSISEKFNPDMIKVNNIAGELEAVKNAIGWARKNNKKKITIYYDLEGIGNWINGSWKAKNQITKDFVSFIEKNKNQIKIDLIKVPAHSGIKYNEKADELSKKSLFKKGYKSYKDSSVYFPGLNFDDCKEICDRLINYYEGDESSLSYKVIRKDRYNRIELSNNTDRIFINSYPNSTYVQGKPSSLLNTFILVAIEDFNEDEVIKTLNKINKFQETEQINKKFDEFLSNYNEPKEGNFYNILISAIHLYLSDFSGPDYTHYVFYMNLAFERCLHRILNSYLDLETSNKYNNNNFSYFNKLNDNTFEFNKKDKIKKLTSEQFSYLNNLYTYYHKNRHPFSHWPQNDIEAAKITNLEDAREYIETGFDIINNYYLLF